MPADERPRQRLLRSGGRSLSDAEVLSLVLGNGSRTVCPLDLARQVLRDHGGISGLVGLEPEALLRRGLGEAKAAALVASLELARRFAYNEMPKRQPMSVGRDVVRYVILRYRRVSQEVLGGLYIDCRKRLVDDREIYRGTLTRASVEPREIFFHALLRGASAVILFHTHPSGDPKPSLEDLAFTRRTAEAGALLGVKVIDHIIVGGNCRWISLADRGVL